MESSSDNLYILLDWHVNDELPKSCKKKIAAGTKRSLKSKRVPEKPSKYSEKDIQILATRFINDPSDENFSILEKRIRWSLRGYIMRMVNDDDKTSEIYSKTLEYIYFGISTYDAKKAKFTTWTHRIAYTTTLKYIERGKVESYGTSNTDCISSSMNGVSYNVNSADFSDMYSCENIVDIVVKDGAYETYNNSRLMEEIYDASISCIDNLPDNLRTVMQERYINKKKLIKISEDNDIPMSSVRNWLIKGRKALGQEVKKKYGFLYDMYMDSCVVA